MKNAEKTQPATRSQQNCNDLNPLSLLLGWTSAWLEWGLFSYASAQHETTAVRSHTITSSWCCAASFREARGNVLLKFGTEARLRNEAGTDEAAWCMWAAMGRWTISTASDLFHLGLCSVSRLSLLRSSKAGHLHARCHREGHGRVDNECFHQQHRCDHHCEGEPVESSPCHPHPRKLNPGPPCQHQPGRVLGVIFSQLTVKVSPLHSTPGSSEGLWHLPVIFYTVSFGNDL